MTTQKTVTSASWRWANPLWWAERQLEATRFAVHVTAAIFDASLSSVYSPLPRVRLEASTYSAPAPQAAAAVTAMLTVAPPKRQLEAAEPHRELQPAVPEADLERLTTQADLDLVTAEADPDLVTAEADPDLVTAEADLEAVVLDAEPATAGPGPDVATTEPPAVAEAGPGPQAPAAEAVHEADAVPSAPVPGWDELTLGSIRARLRRLSEDDLTALQSYEKAHGGRADVLSMLENRLVKVRSTQPES